ncbi:hypothetical protein ACHAPT_002742 [Fusarium lateritium]
MPPGKFTRRFLGRSEEAVADMASRKAPSVQGANGTDVYKRIFEHIINSVFPLKEGQKASRQDGLTMSACGFVNGEVGLMQMVLDEDLNIVGFNDWE